MIAKSFLVFVDETNRESVSAKIARIADCVVISSRSAAPIVIGLPNNSNVSECLDRIEEIEDIKFVTMIFGDETSCS
jgi:nitrate reductase NapAB chaperone NapD